MRDGPLAGVRVLECSRLVAGPFCGRLLSDYGADVLKLETPTGDPQRALGPFSPGREDRECGGLFRALNRGKRSVTLDLETASGQDVLRELVGLVDLVIEDLVPGRFASLTGGDPWQRWPALVVVSISPFGQHGPRSSWKGGDLIACAAGGLAHVTGDPDREPLRPGGRQADHLAGLNGAAGAMLALFHARRTGEGQQVDVSRQEAVAGVLESTVSEYSISGKVRGRMGTRHPAVHGLGLQRLHDGTWLFVGTLPTERMWDAARQAIGTPEWTDDERWRDPRTRRSHADEIDALAAPRFAELDAGDIYPALKASGVPVGLVRDVAGAIGSPQLQARQFFASDAGDDVHLGAPWRMSVTHSRPAHAAPALGAANHEIYSTELGHSADELERWRRAGVI